MRRPRWRTIPHAPDYEVSETGRVRRKGAGRRYLKPQPTGRGLRYLKVNLGRAHDNQLVHRLVCEAFHGPPPSPGMHADHRDNNPHNNAAANLRWLEPALNLGRRFTRDRDGWVPDIPDDPGDDDAPMSVIEEQEIERRLSAAGW